MNYRRYLPAVLVASVAALLVLGIAGAQQGDVNSECVYDIGRTATGIEAYAQDWDETFPPMQNLKALRQIVSPYVPPGGDFICPATLHPYVPNGAYSGAPESRIYDLGNAWILKDALPHADGKKSVAYLDGHVTRGGVDQADPNVECVGDVHELVFAVLEYNQDYGQLPPTKNITQFLTAVYPYVRSHRKFVCPATHLYYKTNPAIGGQQMSAFSDPSTVEVIRDAQPHADGKITIGYLDGHVVRQ